MSRAPDSLARRLWSSNADLAEAALGHPFVRGLAQGTLTRPAFQAYVAQDAFFLEAFARGYALALARSPDRVGLEAFHRLIGGVLDELLLHASYASDWGVELAGVQPSPATLAYTDFLLATASLGTLGETCASLTPCMRLYAYLGQALVAQGANRATNPYQAWVATYAAAEFEALAATLEQLLDRYADERPEIESTYRRALELELAFFTAHVT